MPCNGTVPVYSTCHATVQRRCTVHVMQRCSTWQPPEYGTCKYGILSSLYCSTWQPPEYGTYMYGILYSPYCSTWHQGWATVYCISYNILQYIVTNTMYCMIKSIAIEIIIVPKYCNILYCWSEVLQYIVLLLIWSIAIYCIAKLKYCNILHC